MALTMRSVRLIGGLAAIAFGATLLFAGTAAASTGHRAPAAAPPISVTICHATDSETNPYNVSTPDANGDVDGHAGHTGPVFVPGLKDLHIQWGDIIPPFQYDGGTFPGLNWDTWGQAIWANGCTIPTSLPTVTIISTVTSATTQTTTVTTISVRTTSIVLTEPTTVIVTEPSTLTSMTTTTQVVPTTTTTTETITTAVPTTIVTTVPITIVTEVPTTITTVVPTTVTVTEPTTETVTTEVPTTITTQVPTTITTVAPTTMPVTRTTVVTTTAQGRTSQQIVPVTTTIRPGPPSAPAHTGQDGYGALPYIAMAGGLLLLGTAWRRRPARDH